MGKLTRENYNGYIERVGQKVQKLMARMVVPGQRNNEQVATHTVPGIIQSAKNFFFSKFGEVDVVNQLYANFSSVGQEDVDAATTRGVEDITILAAIKSIASYIAVDRAMTDPETSITYNQILAVNSVGSINEGDTIYDQFKRVPTSMDLTVQRSTKNLTAGQANTLNWGHSIMPGTVVVTISGDGTDTKGKLVGRDSGKDGKFVFQYESVTEPAGTTLVSVPTDGVIDYKAGTVTITAEADTVGAVGVTLDAIADTTGSGILRVKGSLYQPALLVAKSENIVLEGNLQADAYRNKAMQAQMEAGLTMDYAQLTFRQTLDMYVEYINLKLTRAIYNAGMIAIAGQPSGTYIEEDISDIDNATSNPRIVGYRVNNFIERLNARLLTVCKHGMTVIITGITGATLLASIDKTFGDFVKSKDYDDYADGFCGTYNGIPVIRHSYIDSVQTAGYSDFYVAYKDPSGKVGPVANGTYMPLYTTEKALNFNNPVQFAQGLFAYLAIQTLVPELVAVGRVKQA